MPYAILNREELAKTFPPHGVGAEIGVLYGEYARILYSNARPKLLYLVDRWTLNTQDDWPVGSDWNAILSEAKSQFNGTNSVEVIISDSIDWMRSMPTDSLDWIYIDANHSYECVMTEIQEARRIVKPSGIIAGHDYATNPIDDNGKPYPCDVVEAVEEAVLLGYGELIAVTCERIPSWAVRTARKYG